MKDMFGEVLVVGDVVAFPTPHTRGISIGKIESFTQKRMRVIQLKPSCSQALRVIIPHECLKLDKTNPCYIEMILLKS